MAAKKAIGILREFFKEQEKDDGRRATIDDEAAVEIVAGAINPAIDEARRQGVTITVAQGDTIYRIGADGVREVIGKVTADVILTQRRFSL